MVSFIDKLKYSLKSQNPPSLTCEKARLPAPIDKTIKLGLIEGSRKTIDDNIPAAVKPATVAEPKLIRMMAAMSHPKTSGCKLALCKMAVILLLTPLSVSTCLKAPEPAMMSNMSEMSFTASP